MRPTQSRLRAAAASALALVLLGCGQLRAPAPPQPVPPTLAAILATVAPATPPAASTATATFAVPAFTPTRPPAPTATNTPAPTATPTVLPSEVTALDATWNRYVNRRLGFSLKVPKQAASLNGGCAYSDKNGDHSWRPQEQLVPVKPFEDADSVYLAFEYGYKLTGESREGNRSYFAGCERQATTLEALRAERRTWQIVARPARNDGDIEAFLQQRFGAACGIGEKRPTAQEGVQEIRIKGEVKEPPASQCFVNYMTVILYAQQKGMLYSWDLGQAYTFYAPNGQVTYDSDMRASFRVE